MYKRKWSRPVTLPLRCHRALCFLFLFLFLCLLPTPAWEQPLQAARTPWAACTTRCAALACESHSAPTPYSAAPPKTWRTNEARSTSERERRVARAHLGRDCYPPPLCLRHQPPLWHLEKRTSERANERTSERANERTSERPSLGVPSELNRPDLLRDLRRQHDVAVLVHVVIVAFTVLNPVGSHTAVVVCRGE